MSKKNKSNSNALKTLKAKREKRFFGGLTEEQLRDAQEYARRRNGGGPPEPPPK
mgnify:FL=1